MIIICPEHREFEQKPYIHLQGSGCTKCKSVSTGNRFRLSTKEFIEKATTIHGNKYDYSKVNYINTWSKVIIICKEHGEFEQTPELHLSGNKCIKCGLQDIGKKLRLTNLEIIKKFIEVHDNKYNYDKVNHKSMIDKIIITCKKHGEFEQTSGNHLQGKGCPVCNSSKGELVLEDIFKKHSIRYEPQYKLPEIVSNYEIDFYLPDYRLLIEFHGIQHYEYVPFFHDGDYTFEAQKNRDDMVRDAARRWKYNYLEFNYKQFKHMTKEQFEGMVINKINNIDSFIIVSQNSLNI